MKIINDVAYPESLKPYELDAYLSKGWYRMDQHLFSVTHWPNSENFTLDRVWWLRYNINNIKAHRSHQKILKACQEFKISYNKYDDVDNESKELYQKYINSVDFESYNSLDQCLYGNKTNHGIFNSWSINVRHQEKLIAQGIIDLGETTILAKVNFFDPAYKKYSLGKFLILKTLEFMRERGFEWYYPGYVIVGQPKFDYKLFLGKESTEYYNPENEVWKPFCDTIMMPESRTEEEDYVMNYLYLTMLR